MEIAEYKNDLKIIVFDLDGTLAESKSRIKDETAKFLIHLLEKYNVAVISGGSFSQFKKQILDALLGCPDNALQKLFLFPTNGSTCFIYKDGLWQSVYEDKLTVEEKDKIKKAWEMAIVETETVLPDKLYGEIMEDRGTQVTFSLSGQEAPLNIKLQVDPDQEKRLKLRSVLSELLPDFSISVAGMTSIDITRKGIDKKYALEKIIKYLNLSKNQILFVGDKLAPGGNDHGAVEEGVRYLPVDNPETTLDIIKQLI